MIQPTALRQEITKRISATPSSASGSSSKSPVLDATEVRPLLDSIDVSTPIGLRDRALIEPMVFSFGRIGSALAIWGEDVFVQNGRLWLRLCEKGGKQHEMPCHHTLDEYFLPSGKRRVGDK